MQESVIWIFFADLSIEIESILEVWMMNWMSCEHDSSFMDIDCELRIWFGIDGHDSFFMDTDCGLGVWFGIGGYDSCSMNIGCDMGVWFVIWDDLYSMDIDYSRVE